MSCLATKDILSGCGAFDFGGLQRILLLNKSDIDSITKTTDGTITAITLIEGALLSEHQFAKDTGQFTEELSADTASVFYNQTLNYTVTKLTQAQRYELQNAPFWHVMPLIQFNNGEWRALGELGSGLSGVSVNDDSGAAKGDANSVAISFNGANLGKSSTVIASVIETLEAGPAGTNGDSLSNE